MLTAKNYIIPFLSLQWKNIETCFQLNQNVYFFAARKISTSKEKQKLPFLISLKVCRDIYKSYTVLCSVHPKTHRTWTKEPRIAQAWYLLSIKFNNCFSEADLVLRFLPTRGMSCIRRAWNDPSQCGRVCPTWFQHYDERIQYCSSCLNPCIGRLSVLHLK